MEKHPKFIIYKFVIEKKILFASLKLKEILNISGLDTKSVFSMAGVKIYSVFCGDIWGHRVYHVRAVPNSSLPRATRRSGWPPPAPLDVYWPHKILL